jgi:hypothetical protein
MALIPGAYAVAGTLVLMVGCMDGYPKEDAPRTSALSSREHVHALNRYLAVGDGDGKSRFKLPTPCMLKLSGSTSKTGSRGQSIAVESMRISQHADKETGVYRVVISQPREGTASLDHEFAVGQWIDAVAFRSHLQQITFLCLDGADNVAT